MIICSSCGKYKMFHICRIGMVQYVTAVPFASGPQSESVEQCICGLGYQGLSCEVRTDVIICVIELSKLLARNTKTNVATNAFKVFMSCMKSMNLV